MQAIQVKYLPATAHLPARLKAWSYSKKSYFLTCDDSKDIEENARYCALKLLLQLGWQGSWMGGTLPNQEYAFVCFDWTTPLYVGIMS